MTHERIARRRPLEEKRSHREPTRTGRTRREFLRDTARGALGLGLAAGFPQVVPATALGQEGTDPPSERIATGHIGLGGMGNAHLGAFLGQSDVEVAAVCDVSQERRLKAKERTGGKAADCNDYREILDREDIDGVVIATPDHWHALITIHACQAGKDVYVEKPLSLTIEEGRAMVTAARRYGRAVQVGTQQRSQDHFRHVAELIRSGRIGKVRLCRTWIGGFGGGGWPPETPKPKGLDWDLWLGPAPYAPYHPARFDNFRWFRDYSGGLMTDWGTHLIDIVHWGMDMDSSGPVAVEGKGRMPRDGIFEMPETMEVKYEYPEFVMYWTQPGEQWEPGHGYGIKFYGSDGAIFVDREGYKVYPEGKEIEPLGPGDVRLPRSPGHQRDWLDAIKTRRRPICDVEIGHRSTAAPHLGNIAFRLGRRLEWDPKAEQFKNDEEANRLVGKPYRAPWHL